MNRRSIIVISAMTTLGVVLWVGDTGAQQKSPKEQIVGTWMLVSSDTAQPSGTRTPTFGPNAKGIAVFDGSGHYVFEFTAASLPKFASNNRTTGTAEENKAVVQGSLGHYGTYTIDEKNSAFTLLIEGSSFPNWTGTEQKRTFTVSGDELKWITPAGSGGGSVELAWKRAK